MDAWQWQTAAELGRGIGRGEVDPVALAEAYLGWAKDAAVGPRIYARLTPDRAMTEARAASERARAGRRLSPLDGVPVSWKDLYDSAGTATEAGTAMMQGRVPQADCVVLARATEQGLVCLGKTHMAEIAFSGLGINPITATPPNVNDPEAVPGGSSSGAAASVAFGLAPLAIGSDTGGSVRVPAAWNDLVGFKPGHGVLSLEGVIPLCASFDTVGPLARSVEDAALAFAAMGGAAPGFVGTPGFAGTSVKGARLLVCETFAMDDVDEAPMAAFEASLARLTDAGATVERKALPFLEEAMVLSPLLYAPEGWSYWRDLVAEKGDLMFYQIRNRVTAGAEVSAADYLGAWSKLRALRARWAAATRAYDAVVMPTVPMLPPNAQALLDDDALYIAANLKTLRNTRIGNLMGLTALTLPTATPSCGLMLNALPGTEQRLLRLGHAAEKALT